MKQPKDDSHIRASRFWIKYTGNNDPVAIAQFAKMLRSAWRRGAWDQFDEIVADREVKFRHNGKNVVRVVCIALGLFRCQNCEKTFTWFENGDEVLEQPQWCPVCKAQFILGSSVASPAPANPISAIYKDAATVLKVVPLRIVKARRA
jgi:hypothetical protein